MFNYECSRSGHGYCCLQLKRQSHIPLPDENHHQTKACVGVRASSLPSFWQHLVLHGFLLVVKGCELKGEQLLFSDRNFHYSVRIFFTSPLVVKRDTYFFLLNTRCDCQTVITERLFLLISWDNESLNSGSVKQGFSVYFWDRLTQFFWVEEIQPRLCHTWWIDFPTGFWIPSCFVCFCQERVKSLNPLSKWTAAVYIFKAGADSKPQIKPAKYLGGLPFYYSGREKSSLRSRKHCNYICMTQSSLNLKTWKTKWMQTNVYFWMLSLPW